QRAIDRKPDPSPEGLRNVQRLMKIRSPKVGEIKVEDVVDNRIIRKLDESGFIDRAFAAQGMSWKYNLTAGQIIITPLQPKPKNANTETVRTPDYYQPSCFACFANSVVFFHRPRPRRQTW